MPLIADRPTAKKRFKPRTFRPWDLPEIQSNKGELEQVKNTNIQQLDNKETSKNNQITRNSNKQFQDVDVTVNKEATNGQQTVNKELTNGKQTGNKQLTKQVTNRLTNSQQTVNKQLTSENVTVNKQLTNGQQTVNKEEINNDDYRHKIWSLIGNEKVIIDSMFLLCLENGTLTTPPLNLQNISAHTNISNHGIIKTSIFRLTKKEIIKRTAAKTGRGGWSQYTFSTNAYQTLYSAKNNKQLTNGQQTVNKRLTSDNAMVNEQLTNGEQTVNKRLTKQVTERVTNLPSSSNNITNINTTTGLDENYSQIQIPKILKENNFSVNIIKQVQDRGYLSVHDLQSSLDALAFDVTTNKVLEKQKVNNAVAYFMGIVKNKIPYAAPSNFESDEDKAFKEQEIRLQAIKQKRIDREKMLEELAFEEWLEKLSDEEKLKIAPPRTKNLGLGTNTHNGQLKNLYDEMIKKEIQEKLLTQKD